MFIDENVDNPRLRYINVATTVQNKRGQKHADGLADHLTEISTTASHTREISSQVEFGPSLTMEKKTIGRRSLSRSDFEHEQQKVLMPKREETLRKRRGLRTQRLSPHSVPSGRSLSPGRLCATNLKGFYCCGPRTTVPR